MKIASFVTNLPTMDDTRTREDYYKYLGEKPTELGVLGRLYPNNTASFLTESLKNIFYLSKDKGNRYQSVNSFMYEWELEVNNIKRVEFAAVPEGDGAGGTEIVMAFRERYYGKFDTFKIEKTGQHCFCVSNPIRKADNYWTQVVRLVSTNYDTILDFSGCQPGDTTRWISNYHPELHDEGHVKWQSNVERHRGYLCTHRNDASYSAQYAAMEDVFIKIAEDKNGRHSEALYKMDKLEKNLLENFMAARNQALLLGKSNIDKNGKPTIVNPEDNRPIYITDGVIA